MGTKFAIATAINPVKVELVLHTDNVAYFIATSNISFDTLRTVLIEDKDDNDDDDGDDADDADDATDAARRLTCMALNSTCICTNGCV